MVLSWQTDGLRHVALALIFEGIEQFYSKHGSGVAADNDNVNEWNDNLALHRRKNRGIALKVLWIMSVFSLMKGKN